MKIVGRVNEIEFHKYVYDLFIICCLFLICSQNSTFPIPCGLWLRVVFSFSSSRSLAVLIGSLLPARWVTAELGQTGVSPRPTGPSMNARRYPEFPSSPSIQ